MKYTLLEMTENFDDDMLLIPFLELTQRYFVEPVTNANTWDSFNHEWKYIEGRTFRVYDEEKIYILGYLYDKR